MARRRNPHRERSSTPGDTAAANGMADDVRSQAAAAAAAEQQPLLPQNAAVPPAPAGRWVLLAVASGACAAFNGMFAKLTTTELTSSLAAFIAHTLGLTSRLSAVELVIRCMFFGLNLAFNGVMWSLYTSALAKGNSSTQVSIMNTSTNFMITAFLGFAIFSESLPPMWWAGAGLLVAGNVILGRAEKASADKERATAN